MRIKYVILIFSFLLSACMSSEVIISPTVVLTKTHTPEPTFTQTQTEQPTKTPVPTKTPIPTNTPHPDSIDYGEFIVENNLPLDTAPQYGINLPLFDFIRKMFVGLSNGIPFSLNGLDQYPDSNNRIIELWTGTQDIDMGLREVTISKETLKALNGQVVIIIYYDNAPPQPYMEAWKKDEIGIINKGSNSTIYHGGNLMLCGPESEIQYNSYVWFKKSNEITIQLRGVSRVELIRLNPGEKMDTLIEILREYHEISETELPVFFSSDQNPLYNHIILCR